jgi:photosystem II stability/assembly factor-like uncharacterized protein
MSDKNYLLVGTSKGLLVYERSAAGWQVEKIHFLGFPVSVVFVDERTDTWWVCLAHRHWGIKLHRSEDQGQSWTQVRTPRYPKGTSIKEGTPAGLKAIWCMAHAGVDKPGELYLGTEPGGLFHSKDNGDSFELVVSLWNHPSRQKDWFGAGRDYPFIHSIVVDPRDSKHVYIAVSCAGVFETKDGGQSWVPKNKGLIAAYLPNPDVEVGHDPHLLLACQKNPDILWQQNHCGIFRSADAGANWDNVTGKDGFPDYGFALAIDHENPDRAWVAPALSDEMRVAVDNALCICRTDDGGKSWQALRNGLPQENCFDIVFRHSMTIHKNTIAFGTTNGNLYLSENYGDSWQCLSSNLARVDCLAFTKL